MFFAEAATRELSKPRVGLLLHAGFPILKVKSRSRRTAWRRSLIRMMHGPKVTASMMRLDDLPDQHEPAFMWAAGGVRDDVKRDFSLHDAGVPKQPIMRRQD